MKKIKTISCFLMLLNVILFANAEASKLIHWSFSMSLLKTVKREGNTQPHFVKLINADSSFKFIKTIKGKFTLFNVDMLGNIYVITENNKLKKLNPNGDSLSTFNEVKKYGTATNLDVSNPLKVLLFYKNFSTAVFLDRQLVFRSNINFKQQNIFKTKTIAISYDNNIWLFDEQDFKLKKINESGVVLSQTSDMRQLFDEAPSPTTIIDYDNSVYLYDTQKGFFIFDYYGSLKQKLQVRDWKNIAVSNNTIFGITGDTINSYELKTQVQKKYKLPIFFKESKNIVVQNGKVYLLKKNGIDIYSIQ